MAYLWFPLALAVVLGFLAFGQWLRQQRRMMIHRERLAALEKGITLPPVEQEARRTVWNVQRLLLLAGLVWISVGIGFYFVFNAMLAHPTPATQDVPPGLQYVGVGLVGIGLSHLITYVAGVGKDV